MKRTVSGSVLLIIFFIMTALLIAGAALWHSTSLMLHIGHMRQQQVQHEYLTEGLLQYGIGCCKKQINYLLDEAQSGKKSHTIILSKWPPSTGSYQGTLQCDVKEKYCILTAQLLEKQAIVCTARCTLSFKITAAKKLLSLTIDSWTLNAF